MISLNRKKLVVIVFVTLTILYLVVLVLSINHKTKVSGETVGGREFTNRVSNMLSKYPVTNELPVRDLLFEIDYGKSPTKTNDQEAIAIFVTTEKQEDRFLVQDWFTKRGYKLEDYEVIYKIDPSLPTRTLIPISEAGD